MRPALFVLCFLFLSASGLSQSTQSTPNEPEGMRALVAEVRLLRKDLQATNGHALKAQVLLYRLQVQEATVSRVSQNLNDLRSSIAATQERQRNLMATIKHFEKLVDDSDTPPAQRKDSEGEISVLKTELEGLTAEEQQRQTAKIEAEEQLRTEQAKLSALEDRVDRLEKELDNPY
jgi:chromosome segregation ATPase